ncbi:ABC transporter permease [Paenibacillus rhizophilus]|uniref:ABC transporter permease n=1 Tax=Paenibacillus rhizophilus TaxID=1850366 RepID=A0A3N9P402_9BACL|nr:ABC transporter permease [Paenibacillus rhizophilus]RQW10100.1 ABC transporter permease [Paenibacillus rhizophilus]
MHNIMTIAWNLVKRMIGSRRGLIAYIIMPGVIVSIIIWMTGGAGNDKATVLYSNLDKGSVGAHVIAELKKTGDYALVEKKSEGELRAGVLNEEGRAGLDIPAGYTSSLLAGQAPQIHIYELKTSEASITLKMKAGEIGDRLRELASAVGSAGTIAAAGTAEGTTGARAVSSASGTASAMSGTSGTVGGPDANSAAAPDAQLTAILQQAEQHRVGSLKTDYNLYPRQGLDTVTGFMLMFLMAMVTSSVSVIMDDRRQRTMMRIFSAPVRSYEIAVGNFLGSFTVGIIQVAVVLLVGRYVLNYNYELPMYIYFLVLAAFMLVSMGLASTVAGLIRNPNNAGMLNALILTPTCMLGGCFWPISIMPDYMQKAANFVPQKWAIQAADLAATGSGWSELWLPFAVLGLMAAILLAIGSAILRPTEAGISA